jgi:hypothetical protein
MSILPGIKLSYGELNANSENIFHYLLTNYDAHN